jgi:hypothetical protein
MSNVTIISGSINASSNVANVTGTLAVTNGGTGLTSLTAGYIPYGNGTSAFNSTSSFQYGSPTLYVITPSTGTVNLLNFQMSGTRAAGNKYGMYWSDSAGETNCAIWATYTGGNNASALSFGTNAGTGGASGIGSTTERMRINANGNIGIATTSSTSGLEIYRDVSTTGSLTDASLMLSTSGATGRKVSIGFGLGGGVANTCAANIGYDVISGTGAGYGDIYFSTRSTTADSSPTERMRITSGGSLCIGRTTNIFGSGAGLCVETNSNSINGVVTNSGQSAISAVNTAVNTGTSCSLMSFNVGISSGGSQVGTISYNGTLVQYNTTSDQRLKKNIVDAGSGLAKLNNVKIRAFDWVEHNSHTDFGVVAQELNEVAPEAVSAGDTGENIKRMWAVDTSTLVPAMIKAIQELNAKVTALEAQLGDK